MTSPNRPDHPDFWLMAEVLLDLDTASEDGVAMQRICGDIDLESLAYVTFQRIMRLLEQPRVVNGPRAAGYGASWMDGFMAGARFRKVKDGRDIRHWKRVPCQLCKGVNLHARDCPGVSQPWSYIQTEEK